MKIALIHDWLTGMRGGEKCLAIVADLLPDADIFTLFYHKGKLSAAIEKHRIHTSFLQKFPFAKNKYRNYLPLFPLAVERFDLGEYEGVISFSHCVAKGALRRKGARHLCYSFTPMRYVWDMFDVYFNEGNCGKLKLAIIRAIAKRLRVWDARTADRVDSYIAISHYVADRIKRHYDRDADVICPPVDCDRFSIDSRAESDKGSQKQDDYYLVVSALAPYKRLDLAIEAFNKLGKRLKIIGTGQDEGRLRRLASSNIEFLSWVPDEGLPKFYSRCKAFIFPGEEDFGITPLEAAASGRPTIAYGRGGALESILPLGNPRVESPTGIFFKEQNVDSLIAAIELFEKNEEKFQPEKLRAHALKFDRGIYKEKMKKAIEDFLSLKIYE